jgi:hypothetical protein
MLDTDWIFMSRAGRLILHIALLSKVVDLQSNVSSLCSGYCNRIPKPFYDKFNLGVLTADNLLKTQTYLPDFLEPERDRITMKAHNGILMSPVQYEIVVNQRPVLDAEKFEMLTDFYNETATPGGSRATHDLVIQYLLEHLTGKPTRNVFIDDLGLQCDLLYDSATGNSSGVMLNVSSSYWKLDGENYVDVVGNDIFAKHYLQTAGLSYNLYCSTKSVADLLLRVVDGLVPNVALSELGGLSWFGDVHINNISLKSVGASGFGGAEARILVDADTNNAKYIVVGSFNTMFTEASDTHGVPELLADCF